MLGQVHPIDSIYEFIIRKLNPLVVAATSVNSNLHSCMCNEQWIFYENLSVFGGIEKSLSGCNCFEDIYIKFKKTELVENNYFITTLHWNSLFITCAGMESWGVCLT